MTRSIFTSIRWEIPLASDSEGLLVFFEKEKKKKVIYTYYKSKRILLDAQKIKMSLINRDYNDLALI